MAHKTLVGGTAYDIKGGKCLVGGTAYGIKKGRTLIGGTGYDISFGPSVIPVTITGSGQSSFCYVTIDDTKYYEETSGIEVVPGDVISLYAYTSRITNTATITINGTVVKQTGGTTLAINYEWTVPDGLKTIVIDLQTKTASSRAYYCINVIAYEKIGPVQFTIDGVPCYADTNMTWQSWVNSGYNKTGFYVDGSLIRQSDGMAVHDPVVDSVYLATRTIVSGREYALTNY